ncbi:hypothetical protein E3P92_01524 [Wallemia ichthyophaga]|nr:hypothetical protein E3P92_01524 [Wallemia ichthyophaga]
MITAVVSTAVSQLLDIILSAYVYNGEFRYPFFITFTEFAILAVFARIYTSIRTSKCAGREAKNDDTISASQYPRVPKVSYLFTLLLAVSWFLMRILFNLSHVQVRIGRASEAAIPFLLLPACSYFNLIHIDAPTAALTIASSLTLIVNGAVNAESISAPAVLLQVARVVSQAIFLTCLNKTIKDHHRNPIFALNAYAPYAALISLIGSVAFEGIVPLHDLPIIGLVILLENVLFFLANQISVAFLLHKSNVIAWSSVSHLITVSLVLISMFVTKQALPLGQAVVTTCSAFLSMLLLRTQFLKHEKATPPTTKIHLHNLAPHLDISHVTGIQPLKTPPNLSRTNSSQRLQHPQ